MIPAGFLLSIRVFNVQGIIGDRFKLEKKNKGALRAQRMVWDSSAVLPPAQRLFVSIFVVFLNRDSFHGSIDGDTALIRRKTKHDVARVFWGRLSRRPDGDKNVIVPLVSRL